MAMLQRAIVRQGSMIRQAILNSSNGTHRLVGTTYGRQGRQPYVVEGRPARTVRHPIAWSQRKRIVDGPRDDPNTKTIRLEGGEVTAWNVYEISGTEDRTIYPERNPASHRIDFPDLVTVNDGSGYWLLDLGNRQAAYLGDRPPIEAPTDLEWLPVHRGLVSYFS